MPLPTGVIDLRSDTTTFPLPEMMDAMMHAPLGDDVYGNDPTVNRLQEIAAEMTGQEAGLFVASGTMGNLVALLTHCERGSEVVLGNMAHIFLDEAGGMAGLAGLMARTLPNQPDGTLRLEDIEDSVRPNDIHCPRSRLLCLENTQNTCGGVVLSAEYTRQAAELAHANGMKLHIDGARLFNAAAALGVRAAELSGPADSVQFCISKGLCAPVGSLLCGSKDWIAEANRFRKQVGGGMRQAGVLAAAGIVALKVMPERLLEDHCRAKVLAEGLAQIPGVSLSFGMPQTNMVYVNLGPQIRPDTEEITERMLERGIWLMDSGPHSFRFVTHFWVSDADVERTLAEFAEVVRGG